MRARALFVTAKAFVAEGAVGGVQQCTREYLRTLEQAGLDLELVTFEPDRRLIARVARQFDSSPYVRPYPPDLPSKVIEAAAAGAEFVFLNQVTISGLAAAVRERLPQGCRIVALSHGAEVTDLAHTARVRTWAPLSGRMRPTPTVALGRALRDEIASRGELDLVVNLSSFDSEIERWFGASQTCWLPRIVEPSPLALAPLPGRLGFVGTLDHAPNLEGLVQALEALDAGGQSFEVRLVSGSDRVSRWLADRFPAVRLLGPLGEAALREEASSWMAFLHPIFCAARGCSTKLAQAMSWGLPIVTTPQGRRGYRWAHGGLLEADTPAQLAACCVKLLSPVEWQDAHRDVSDAARASPTLAEVADEMRDALGLPRIEVSTGSAA